MTAPSLLDELEEVMRLSNEADRLPYGEGRAYAYRDATVRALNFVLDYHATLADMANELRVARESFKRCDEICKCTAEGWRTAEEDMAKRLEAAERDAARWRHARKLLTVDDIEGAQGSYDSFGRLVSEDECKRADDAIDVAAREGEG